MKKIVFTALLLSALTGANSKSIWVDRSLYSPDTELNPGSVLVVNVIDLSDLKYNIEFTTKSNSQVSSVPDAIITGFLPKVTATKKINSGDSGKYAVKNQIKMSIAAVVQNRNAQGLYAITGTKTYRFGGSTSSVMVNGLVDPAIVRGRSIDSSLIADFRIEIRVAADGINLQRQRLAIDAKASGDLTEQEKQDIIIDYLQKMLREIER